jgi:hypothetical protein
MGISKRSWINKVKKQRYWENEDQKIEKNIKPVNKTIHCHKYENWEGKGGGTVIVEIREGKCSIAGSCYAICRYKRAGDAPSESK